MAFVLVLMVSCFPLCVYFKRVFFLSAAAAEAILLK